MNIRPSVSRACAYGSSFMALIALMGCEPGAEAASPSGGSHPLIGNPAPEFDLPAQSGGKRVSLDQAKGKVAIVDFWATWCAPCRASFPKYQALSQKYSDSLVVMGISEDDEGDGIADFAKDTGATFPLAWDSEKSVAGKYKPESMPTSYILDKNGMVRFVHNGFREGEEQEIEKQIKSLNE